jgi:hypothetical protein
MRFASAKAQPGGGVEENSDTGGGPPQLLDEDDAPCGRQQRSQGTVLFPAHTFSSTHSLTTFGRYIYIYIPYSVAH